ncbi:MAG: serine hydrolase [Nitrospiraceae bacterium]|nr:serine hydrolase [Nitrospiraceae bacterium]
MSLAITAIRACRLPVLFLAAFLLFTAAMPAAAFSPKAIPAKAAIVIDDSGTVLFSKFPNARLAPASTVKLVTAMVALDLLDPSHKVVISRNASRIRTISPKLCPGEELTVSDLLHFALMRSINQAAVALAEAAAGSEDAFVALMNRKARELGAKDTQFVTASGLPKGVQYTTPRDLALLMKASLSYPLIREILGKKGYVVRTSEGREIFLESSNDLLWQDRHMIGGKTGYTGNARHCFVGAIMTDKGLCFTAVMGARSRRSLWKSTMMLAEIGMNPELASQHARRRARLVQTPVAPLFSRTQADAPLFPSPGLTVEHEPADRFDLSVAP